MRDAENKYCIVEFMRVCVISQEGTVSKMNDLRREIREREEKIMILEGEVTKWEQRYLQEAAMRQLAIEAASLPKLV